eukprot:2856631-Rhodomonas_salina.1
MTFHTFATPPPFYTSSRSAIHIPIAPLTLRPPPAAPRPHSLTPLRLICPPPLLFLCHPPLLQTSDEQRACSRPLSSLSMSAMLITCL